MPKWLIMIVWLGWSDACITTAKYMNCMPTALQAVTEQQAQREAMFSVDAKTARRKSAANAMLPRVFDTLRAVFGAAGPAVRLYDEVKCVFTRCCWAVVACHWLSVMLHAAAFVSSNV